MLIRAMGDALDGVFGEQVDEGDHLADGVDEEVVGVLLRRPNG
jgi:hypothetical protein